MNVSAGKPLPYKDEDSAIFWEALAKGRLVVQACQGCGTLRWPARAICNKCFSFEHEWRPLSGRGKIWSWVRTWQPFMPAFKADLPYTTVCVQLAEQSDVFVLSHFVGNGREAQIGMPVEAITHEAAADTGLLFWRPVNS